MEGVLALDDTDYEKTPKLTWLAKVDAVAMTPTVIVHFDHLITKGVLKPDENFKDFVNRDSKVSSFPYPHPYHIYCPWCVCTLIPVWTL